MGVLGRRPWAMPKRSKVKLYEHIRKADEREQLSIHELARRFGVHRRDVRQGVGVACAARTQAGGAAVAVVGSVEADDRRVVGGGPPGTA